MQLRANTKANLKPDLKMKVVWNTCDKKLGGEMKSTYEIYTPKVHFETPKSDALLEKVM